MKETIIRAISGAIYVTLLLTFTLYSRVSLLLLFGFFLLQTINEYCKIVKINNLYTLAISILIFCINTWYNSPILHWILVIATTLSAIYLTYWLFKNKHQHFPKFPIVVATGYLIIPFLLITKIGQFSTKLIISIFIIIWVNDTFAYLIGKSIGKHKLLPLISPKKTIEGFIGGILFALIASIFIAKYYVPLLTVSGWVVIALLTCIFGSIGDLVESKFKRIAKIKDSGTIMPGHGGLLDRLDSIIFAIPFVYLFLKISGYVS